MKFASDWDIGNGPLAEIIVALNDGVLRNVLGEVALVICTFISEAILVRFSRIWVQSAHIFADMAV